MEAIDRWIRNSPSPMRLLVCGDRFWGDGAYIEEILRGLPNVDVIIHGGAAGADTLAGEAAKKLGIPVIECPADWSLGKRGGPVRNRTMLHEHKPNAVLAFHTDITKSVGTADMVRTAAAAGLGVLVMSGGEDGGQYYGKRQ